MDVCAGLPRRRGADPAARVTVLVVALLLAGGALAAQVPDSIRPDSLRARSPADSARPGARARAPSDSVHRPPVTRLDSLRVDSLRADSASRDSTRQSDLRYQDAQRRATVRVPTLAPLGAEGPRPPFSRIVMTRDSIEWANAETVGDLLTRVPGVFIWRQGWVGRAELANYQARGSTAVEYALDGVPYVPIGTDSTAVDASLFALSLLDRVEVDRWPGLLRVRLYTRRYDRLAPRSRLGVATGSGTYTRYQGSFERRSLKGIGFGVAADYLTVASGQGAADAFNNTQLLLEGGYVPSDRVGVEYRILRSRPNRHALALGSSADSVTGFRAERSDVQLRASFHPRPGPTGPSLDLVYTRTGWADSVLQQQVNQLGVIGSLLAPAASVTASIFHRTRWTPLDARLEGHWSPVGPLTLLADAELQHHDGGRASRWLGARAAIGLPYGFVVGGAARWGRVVSAPALLADTAQHIADLQATLGWERPRIGFELGLARNAAFAPTGFEPFPTISTLLPVPSTRWLTAAGHVAPVPWVTLESWFSTPRPLTAEGQPPAQAVTRATFDSKFLRRFPSGILNIKLQLSVEHWSAGVLGRDLNGDPVPTPVTNFLRSLVEVRLWGVGFYWQRTNLSARPLSYVPGYPIASYLSSIGVHWDFTN